MKYKFFVTEGHPKWLFDLRVTNIVQEELNRDRGIFDTSNCYASEQTLLSSTTESIVKNYADQLNKIFEDIEKERVKEKRIFQKKNYLEEVEYHLKKVAEIKTKLGDMEDVRIPEGEDE